MAESHKLAVLVHHNNEVTVLDERGYPRVCRDCRFSGWLTGYERQTSAYPRTCLLYSGGADSQDGDRVIFDGTRKRSDESWYSAQKAHNRIADHWRQKYPACFDKNPEGNCPDFVRAKPLRWWGNFWRKLFRREWRTRKMRH